MPPVSRRAWNGDPHLHQQFNALIRQAPGATRDMLLALLEQDEPQPT